MKIVDVVCEDLVSNPPKKMPELDMNDLFEGCESLNDVDESHPDYYLLLDLAKRLDEVSKKTAEISKKNAEAMLHGRK